MYLYCSGGMDQEGAAGIVFSKFGSEPVKVLPDSKSRTKPNTIIKMKVLKFKDDYSDVDAQIKVTLSATSDWAPIGRLLRYCDPQLALYDFYQYGTLTRESEGFRMDFDTLVLSNGDIIPRSIVKCSQSSSENIAKYWHLEVNPLNPSLWRSMEFITLPSWDCDVAPDINFNHETIDGGFFFFFLSLLFVALVEEDEGGGGSYNCKWNEEE